MVAGGFAPTLVAAQGQQSRQEESRGEAGLELRRDRQDSLHHSSRRLSLSRPGQKTEKTRKSNEAMSERERESVCVCFVMWGFTMIIILLIIIISSVRNDYFIDMGNSL